MNDVRAVFSTVLPYSYDAERCGFSRARDSSKKHIRKQHTQQAGRRARARALARSSSITVAVRPRTGIGPAHDAARVMLTRHGLTIERPAMYVCVCVQRYTCNHICIEYTGINDCEQRTMRAINQLF